MTDVTVGKVRTVLFDLDGTFADTAQDLAYALNRVLSANSRTPLPFERIRPVVSHGGAALIELGFGLPPGSAEAEPLRQQLLDIYQDNICRHTRLFDGMAEVIDQLEETGCLWGIVTNKPSWLTEPLMEGLGLMERAACIVSGDTAARPKPDPAPILHACEVTSTSPGACLYVGDAKRDIEAGQRAGAHTLVALFGYISERDRPQQWGADGCIQSPQEILQWLRMS